MKVQLATVSITDTMPRLWRMRGGPLGFYLRLPDYRPMGGKRTPLALSVLVQR